MKTVDWNFPLRNLASGADGSTMSKLFRGGALSDTALLARESIQNSTDAAQSVLTGDPNAPTLRVVFRFVHLYGDEKAAAVESLSLHGLHERRSNYKKDPLQPGNALDDLDDPKVPLSLLFVEDYGTHGLFGTPSIGKNSHLFMAMYYIGASDKAADAGGSYGFGKSALERASRTHSVIAHTAFGPFQDDPVRERLVGFTWWPDLQQGDQLWGGQASFAELRSEGTGGTFPYPFEDERAKELASALGFQPRDPSDVGQLGTSFLIVDPAIEPDALLREIETWWWPALEEHNLNVEVVLPTGEVVPPKPASNITVAPYLKGFRIATGLDEPGDSNRERLASDEWRDRSGTGGKDLGKLALVLQDEPHMELDDSESGPVVALMRGPRMVVQYWRGSRSRVPLRGVFVASDKINALLRETEPSSHDRWTDNSSGDLPQEATETARTVLDKIRTSVRRMASEITPPPPKTNKALGHFSKLMEGFLGDKRGPGEGPKPGGERIELQFPDGRPSPEVLDDDNVRVKARFTVRVADNAEGPACIARVACYLFIHEDESQSQSKWPLVIRPLEGVDKFAVDDDGAWVGTIDKATKVLFEVTSEPYPNLWTTSLQPNVTRIGDWIKE